MDTGAPAPASRRLMVLLARNRSLQIALMVPVLAALLGLATSFRMMRLPDVKPSAPLEGMDFG